ncbi:PAS domain-containing protein [Streptomyces sp. MMG1121]|uniref:PAS domain-containing protein n=1 Tax=Streptomyces sp. MMG1121 TaxID=1415544 RepID=UPI00099DFBC0
MNEGDVLVCAREPQMNASDELLHMPDPAALLTLDGSIRSLNPAMATVLGKPTETCLGHDFGDLWPAGESTSAESLVAHAAKTKTAAMRVLQYPGPGGRLGDDVRGSSRARQRRPSGRRRARARSADHSQRRSHLLLTHPRQRLNHPIERLAHLSARDHSKPASDPRS